MQSTATQTTQLFTPFGGGFVHEEGVEATRSHLAMSDPDRLISSVTISMLGEVMRSLRSALSLR
jgi:hypothetical protein